MRRLRSPRQQPGPHGGRPGPSTDSADQDASYGLIVESINPQHSGGDVIESVWDGIYRVIRRCGGARSDEMLRDPARQGSVLTPIASARLLSETFYPQDLEETDTQEQRERRAGVMEGLRRIGASEVWTVLRGMNPKKAPGELLWTLGSGSILSPRQYGFMPQRSTEDALYGAVSMVRALRAQGRLVVVISVVVIVNLEAAFQLP